jgi:deazaflavin-dependent oxidoreductase (nitroreductase family)
METEHFLRPKRLARAMNRIVGLGARLGFVPRYIYLLKVRGRRSGKIYSTPVNVLKFKGRLYLVGGRGHTTWSRNAASAGEVTLVRGKSSRRYRIVEVPDDQKPEILRAYLVEYRLTVQRFFAVAATSPLEAFRGIVDRHPVFEIVEA